MNQKTDTPTSDNGNGTVLLLKPAEAARALAICPRKLWELTNTGEMPTVRIGRVLRYAVGDIQKWIEENKRAHLH